MKNASFSNVDGPRNDHTKGSKSERKTETMIPLYVESKIKNERTYLGNINRHTDIRNRLRWPRGRGRGVGV